MVKVVPVPALHVPSSLEVDSFQITLINSPRGASLDAMVGTDRMQ